MPRSCECASSGLPEIRACVSQASVQSRSLVTSDSAPSLVAKLSPVCGSPGRRALDSAAESAVCGLQHSYPQARARSPRRRFAPSFHRATVDGWALTTLHHRQPGLRWPPASSLLPFGRPSPALRSVGLALGSPSSDPTARGAAALARFRHDLHLLASSCTAAGPMKNARCSITFARNENKKIKTQHTWQHIVFPHHRRPLPV